MKTTSTELPVSLGEQNGTIYAMKTARTSYDVILLRLPLGCLWFYTLEYTLSTVINKGTRPIIGKLLGLGTGPAVHGS